ncbi:MAG: S8 family serine peptidase [Cyclobacteriaceae bacterium]
MLKRILLLLLILHSALLAFPQHLAQPSNPKIAPSLKKNYRRLPELTIEVSDSASFFSWVRKEHPQWLFKSHSSKLFIFSNPEEDAIDELMQAKSVLYVDNGGRIAREETVLGDFDMTMNSASAVHALHPDLAGEGIIISIKEKPFDINDVDLKGRVILNENFDEPSTLHATIMATVAAGAGNTSSFGKGVAWKASVTSSDFENLLPDPSADFLAAGVSLQNHSYGVGVENYYGIEAKEYDQSCAQSPEILHVFSSGNEGESSPADGYYQGIPGLANLTGQFKASKNTISVGSSDRYGNVVPMSSKGPAYDGRVKPELIAYGDGGSSEASAVVTGVSALLQHAYKNKYLRLPDAALVKATLVNSADDAGRPYVDFETGFGNVNALRAVRTITEERIRAGELTENEELVFDVDVPANQGLLKVTLAWNDPAGEPFSSKALVNDLDLSVYAGSTSETFLPWILQTENTLTALQSPAQRGIDTLNNIEQVTVVNPPAGVYQLKVKGSAVPQGPQSFYLVFEWASGFELLYPRKRNALRSNTTNIIRWSWFASPVQGKLEYKFADNDQWQVISESVPMQQRYYEWIPPDTTGLLQLRFKVGTEGLESDTIALSAPQRLQVGFNCDQDVLFLWHHDPSATGYILYRLGEKYLEPVAISTDTFAIVSKNDQGSDLYSIAPLYVDQAGVRESTIDFNLQGVGCYFKSFLPLENIVTDRAIFAVELGTTYNLESVALERYADGAFETIEVISNGINLAFTFTDPDVRSDLQSYRLRLKTKDGTVAYSSEVQVLFLGINEIYVYPNPAPAGSNANIIVNEDTPTLINLYNMHGKLVRQFEDFEILKTISTSGLPGGTYVLRMRLQNGKILTAKLILL